MDLIGYLDTARARAGLTSDRRLGDAIGVSKNSISQYRLGIATPHPAVMLRLAELAGVPGEVALLDRASWQADDTRSRDVMARLRSLVAAATAACLLFVLVLPAVSATIVHDTIHRTLYIMENNGPGEKPGKTGRTARGRYLP